MSGCWSEGDLRAALDGEMDASSAARLTAHLAECASCQALRQELAGRASLVAGMMATLEDEAPFIPSCPMPPIPAQHWHSTAAIGAIAAGLAIIALTVPHRPPSKLIQHANATYPNLVASQNPPVVPVQPVSPTHPRHRLLRGPEQRAAVLTPVAAQPVDTDQGYFLTLDDEPIETGIVMRVASPSGDFQADVIVGPDGRAHAIRIVNDGK